jgi:hypothetical protein
MTMWRGRGREKDRGAVTVFFAVMAAAWIVIFASVIVGGARIRYLQLAENIAAEAARAGGQTIELGQAVDGGAKEVDLDRYEAAITAYVRALDEQLPGTFITSAVDSPTPDTVRVTVTVTYDAPIPVPWSGATTGTAIGTATATLIVQ